MAVYLPINFIGDIAWAALWHNIYLFFANFYIGFLQVFFYWYIFFYFRSFIFYDIYWKELFAYILFCLDHLYFMIYIESRSFSFFWIIYIICYILNFSASNLDLCMTLQHHFLFNLYSWLASFDYWLTNHVLW